MTKFFVNIENINKILFPKSRGISMIIQSKIGVTTAGVSYWRKGTLPNRNNLAKLSLIFSKLLSDHYNFKIQINPEQLRDGDIKAIIDEQLKKPTPVNPDPNINPGIVSEPKIEYTAETEIAAGLQAFIDSPEWQLARVTAIEAEFLKSIRFYSTGKPTKEDFIQLLLIYRGIEERGNLKTNGD
jgi:hypothetical protein